MHSVIKHNLDRGMADKLESCLTSADLPLGSASVSAINFAASTGVTNFFRRPQQAFWIGTF